MRSLRNLSLTLFSGTALLLAQDPQTGGWRRAGDPPPPAPVERAQPQDPGVLDQDPTQPVARSDGYGQVDQQTQVQQQPQLQQRQAQRPPAAIPHYGLPPAVQIKPGTFITMRLNQVLSSDHNQQGDLFTGTLQQPIVADGIVVAQRGQTVVGRVADAQRSGHGRSSSRLALQLTALTLADGTQANVQSQLVNRRGPSNVGNDVGTVATTTAMGAAIGAAADWGRGAAIGAGAGAAAGIIGVLLTPGRPTIVSPESLLTFRIDSQVIVDLTRASAAFRYVAPDEFERPVQTSMGPPPQPRVYGAPYPAPAYYGGYYAPYSPWGSWGSFWGPSFGVGVVIRGGGWGRGWGGWGGYRRWR